MMKKIKIILVTLVVSGILLSQNVFATSATTITRVEPVTNKIIRMILSIGVVVLPIILAIIAIVIVVYVILRKKKK